MIRSSCAFGDLPQLAAVRLLPDLRRRRRAEAVQLRRRRPASSPPTGDRRRAERDPAAPAGARARAASATPAASSSRRATTTRLEIAGRRGPRRCRRTRRCTLARSAGQTVLRGQRDAQAAAARLRARGLPQPRRLQRLPPALGRAGLLRAARRCARNYETRAERVHGPRHRRRQAVARGEEDHLRRLGRHHPPRGPAARGRRRRRRTSPDPQRRSTPARPTTARLLHVQGVAPHRARRTAPPTSRRWRPATCCRWRSCRARPTATTCCSSTPTTAAPI